MINLKHELESIFYGKNICNCLAGLKNDKYNHIISLINDETKFLDEDNINVAIKERIYCIINNITERLNCYNKECNNKIIKYYGPTIGYRKFCSNTCSQHDIDIRNKAKQTCIERYGVEYALQSEEIKEKSKQTCIERYGVEYIGQVEEVKEKSKQTCIERYGVEYALQSEEIKEKSKQTCIERYGVEYIGQVEEVKEKSKQTCVEKYGVEHVLQSKEIKDKKNKTCIERYGTEIVLQCKEIRDRKDKTSIERYGTYCIFSLKEFKEKIAQTCIIRYGVRNPLQSKEIRDKKNKTMVDRYGVEHSLQSEEIRNKMKLSNMEKYGVEYTSQVEEFKEKSKQTCIKRYGVEYVMQVFEIFQKAQKSGFKLKKYILPSGENVEIQGYENKFLDEHFLNGGYESDILIKDEDIESKIGIIYYNTPNGKKHRYYPDFYLINENKIIEVKSLYTSTCNVDTNELKRQACLRMGLKFEYKIYDKNKKLI